MQYLKMADFFSERRKYCYYYSCGFVLLSWGTNVPDQIWVPHSFKLTGGDENWRKKLCMCLLIHLADPQSRTVVNTIFSGVCKSVRPHFSKSGKTNQTSNENNIRCWRDCGSGQVDHGRLLSIHIYACLPWKTNWLLANLCQKRHHVCLLQLPSKFSKL